MCNNNPFPDSHNRGVVFVGGVVVVVAIVFGMRFMNCAYINTYKTVYLLSWLCLPTHTQACASACACVRDSDETSAALK